MPKEENQTARRRAANSGPKGQGRFASSARPTLADQIYEHLYHKIIHLELTPGMPLLEREIAVDFNASRTPVREAILRLTKEMLVEVVPKSGTFVARIPLSILPEALVARRALECDLVRRAAQHVTHSRVLRLRAIVEENREAAQDGDQKVFDRTDGAFHAELAAMSGYPGLWRVIQQIKAPIDRHRHLTLPVEGRMDQVVQEHSDIVDALEKEDGALAAKRMDKHIRQLKDDIAKTVERHPDYFIYDLDLSDIDDR